MSIPFRYVFSRLAQAVLVLFVVYSITFWMLMALPGDPFVGERHVPEPVRQALAQRFHAAGSILRSTLCPQCIPG